MDTKWYQNLAKKKDTQLSILLDNPYQAQIWDSVF